MRRGSKIFGWIMFGLGLALIPFFQLAGVFIAVLGIIIALNKSEDKIEEINYSKIKKPLKGRK